MKRTFYTIGSLIILLICAFVFVALPAMVGKGGAGDVIVFGKYDGKEIRYEQDSDFVKSVQDYAQYFQRMGMQIDNSNSYYIYNYAFNATVAKMASEAAVAKTGWKPSVEAINREMRPYFYDESGKYSSKLYKQTSDSEKTRIKKNVEGTLIANRFNDDVFGSEAEAIDGQNLYGLKESDKELDFLVDYGKSKRGFNMAVFSKSDYPDEEKISFGKSNSAKFIQYDMSVITVENESEAKKILKRLSSEEISFEDAVAEYSTKSYGDTEGKLNSSYGYQIENMIEDGGDYATVCGLANGTLSGVVAIKSGYAIFRADGDSSAPDFESDDIIPVIYSYLNSYETSVIENYYIAKAKDFITDASIKGFDAACDYAGVNKIEVEPFPLNFGNVSVTDTLNTSVQGLSSAAENENFLTSAFSLKMDEFSAPLVLGSNIIVLQYVKEDVAETTSESVIGELGSYDTESASNAIMNSPKLENKFSEVYFSQFMR